jgi:hypothetical protein
MRIFLIICFILGGWAISTCSLVAADEVEERVQREARERAEYMRRWDRNGDGMIAPDEVYERGRESFQRRVQAMGLDPSQPVPIETYLGERSRMELASARGTEYKPQWRSDPSMAFGTDAKLVKAEGFDKPISDDEKRVLGLSTNTSGASASTASRQVRAADDKFKRYAQGLIERYDENKNGQIDGDEIRKVNNGERYDSNKDGKITYDELVLALSGGGSSSSSARGSSSSSTRGSSDERRRDDDRRSRYDRGQRESDQRSSQRREGDEKLSYRFTPAIERLPKGTPSWFVDKDANEDGMVAMHEYSSRWTDTEVRKFQSIDTNNDGVITPSEAIAGGR